MPKELKSLEQFQNLLPKAVELRVLRQRDFVKLKLRTPELLYTFKTNEDEADDIIKNAKELEVVDFSRTSNKEKDDEDKGTEDKKKEEVKKKKK